MDALSRKLGLALAGIGAAASLADAATRTVLLHTQTTIPKLLTDNASGLVTMEKAPLGGNLNQRWGSRPTRAAATRPMPACRRSTPASRAA